MLYAIHHGDDHATPGAIYQANKVYVSDLKPYENVLGDLGHKHVKVNLPGLLPPESWFVWKGSIFGRPRMHPVATKYVKAGADAVITDIPMGAAIDILAAGVSIASLPSLDGDELQFTMPTCPCRVRVIIRKWPYQDCSIYVEGL